MPKHFVVTIGYEHYQVPDDAMAGLFNLSRQLIRLHRKAGAWNDPFEWHTEQEPLFREIRLEEVVQPEGSDARGLL